MKTAGVIGGIGPESTLEYYRLLVAGYRQRTLDGGYPSIIINSIDLKRMLDLITANQIQDMTSYLLQELERLGRAGVDFAALAANTPHVAFDALSAQSPVPLISIVEVACAAAKARRFSRVGLLGTRFTMQGRFYADVFGPAGIDLVVPSRDEQAYVHDKYMSELVHGVILPETRGALSAIVRRLKEQEGIEAVILGGTELPLILRDTDDHGLPLLDTTKLHVEEIIARLLS